MESDKIIFGLGTEQYPILGLGREEIRSRILIPYKEFQKSAFSENTADNYGAFHVFYNKNNVCEAIEFFSTYAIKIEEHALMHIGRKKIKNILLNLDADIEEDQYGMISKEHSIGISCPMGKVETVLVGVPGYYDD